MGSVRLKRVQLRYFMEYEHFSVVLSVSFSEPIQSLQSFKSKPLSRVSRVPDHDALHWKNFGTPSAHLPNYHCFCKTFLWRKHAVDRSTDPWLLNGEVVCSSRSLFRSAANCTWLPLRISEVLVFLCVILYTRTNSGSKIKPCSTPYFILVYFETVLELRYELMIWTLWYLFWR